MRLNAYQLFMYKIKNRIFVGVKFDKFKTSIFGKEGIKSKEGSAFSQPLNRHIILTSSGFWK
ncbi:hypothetical protein Hdeb2414_s0008g00287041 [Helianthus debilis subsp. tardiflorus]